MAKTIDQNLQMTKQIAENEDSQRSCNGHLLNSNTSHLLVDKGNPTSNIGNSFRVLQSSLYTR